MRHALSCAMVVLLVMAAGCAHADEADDIIYRTPLPLPPLQAGHGSVFASVGRSTDHHATWVPAFNWHATQRLGITSEFLNLRLGLGHGFEAGASLSAFSSLRSTTVFDDGQAASSSQGQGWQNPSFSIAWRSLGDETSTTALRTELRVAPNTGTDRPPTRVSASLTVRHASPVKRAPGWATRAAPAPTRSTRSRTPSRQASPRRWAGRPPSALVPTLRTSKPSAM